MKFVTRWLIVLSLIAIPGAKGLEMPAQAPDNSPAENNAPASVQRVSLNSEAPCIGWLDNGKPVKAAVLCLHELGMHSGVFEPFAQKMAARGIACYAMDLRGFGSWSRDERMSIDKSFEDALATIKVIRKTHPNVPVFVLGEAMGGALALKVAAEHPELVNGAISSAPGGEHFNQARMDMQVGSRLVTAPDKRFDIGKQFVEDGTPDENKRKHFEEDSLVRLQLTPRECMQCQFFMFKSGGLAGRIKSLPVLIVQGEKDHMSKPHGARHVFAKLPSANKQSQIEMVEDSDHYCYEGIDVPDKLIETTASFIIKHLPNS